MKKTLKILTIALAAATLASCGETVSKTETTNIPGVGYSSRDYVSVMDLNKHIVVGQKDQINLDVMPDKYGSKITFESKDSGVVTVSESGELTAIARGKTQVHVKAEDGSVIAKVNVLVSDGKDTDVSSTMSTIKANYENPSYVAPKKAHRREYSEEVYYKNGVRDHSYQSYEDIYFDSSRCYFMVSSDDLYTYTAGGARELSGGKWIFQVQGMKLRMVHITDIAKTYLDFNIANEKYEDDFVLAIYDVLDMFFVSGKKIATDLLDDYSGKTDFMNAVDFFGEEGTAFYADGANNLFVDVSYSQNLKISTEDELKYVDIFEGTPYKETTNYHYLFENTSSAGFDLKSTYDYKVGDVPWKRNFVRSMQYDLDYEVEEYKANDEDMKLAGWTKVTSLYDL